jgi:hypothetical protein
MAEGKESAGHKQPGPGAKSACAKPCFKVNAEIAFLKVPRTQAEDAEEAPAKGPRRLGKLRRTGKKRHKTGEDPDSQGHADKTGEAEEGGGRIPRLGTQGGAIGPVFLLQE